MPHKRATRKCPPSCKTMSRPSPMIAMSIDSISARLAWRPAGSGRSTSWAAERPPLGSQESKNRSEQERHRPTGTRSHHVDSQLFRTPLEHRFEKQPWTTGAHDHREGGESPGDQVAAAKHNRVASGAEPRKGPTERRQRNALAGIEQHHDVAARLR